MGSAPDTTLGPRVFGDNYFSNKANALYLDKKVENE
jgi:hypothetical protein